MIVLLSRKDPPIGAAITCSVAGVSYQWGNETQLVLDDNISLTTSHAISRHVVRLNPGLNLYPSHILHRTQVDHWLSVASSIGYGGKFKSVEPFLNTALAPSHCLVPPNITVADYEIFGALYRNLEWHATMNSGSAPQHLLRWYNSILSKVSSILSALPDDVKAASTVAVESSSSNVNNQGASSSAESSSAPRTSKREEGGKFVELPGAKMGEVVVRFPPEASGYLHIGHAKAALLNQHYQLAFKGKLIMRFDDTNPAKENAHFEKVILEDLKLLEITPDRFTHTSDYFDYMIECCEKLMASGLAYVDDTDAETMKAEREERKASKNRNNSLQKNMQMWKEMLAGSDEGVKCCVRAKIDMNSNNGCMRDPTIYRCKPEEHVRTGTKYKVYPTYDFACPIVDSIEGVTHALRTTEYHDRDEQFFWFLEKLELRKLHIYEYSRLNMNNTVLSKRKLTWFVQQGLVDGWDDPRFPTVRGILRRGMTVEGLKDFIIAQGSSRSVVNMEWDKIWSFNKKVIDAKAPRYTALEKNTLVPVKVSGATEQATTAQKHPKDPSIGTKTVWVGPRILIESVDAEALKEGENATFINWGNLIIKKINRANGKVVSVDAQTNLSNTDYKKTLKLTWLVDNPDKSPCTPVVCTYFDHLINKGVLSKDEDFKTFIGHPTRFEMEMIGDDELKKLKTGDIIQIQRKGFFRVDEEYKPVSLSSCKESPVVLFFIPDGHTKENIVATSTNKSAASSEKEKAQSAKSKKAEKSPQEECKPIVASGTSHIVDIHNRVKEQGDKIRQLKSDKADKNIIMSEVAILKDLKAIFKAASGVEWTPDINISQLSATTATSSVQKPSPSGGSSSAEDMNRKVIDQGNVVRSLKAKKASKDEVTSAVNILLNLKKEFKEATGVEWKPDIDMSQFKKSAAESEPVSVTAGIKHQITVDAISIHERVLDQGNSVRMLKANKAPKEEITAAVNILLGMKKEFKEATGIDWKPDLNIIQFERAEDEKPAPAPSKVSSGTNDAESIHNKVVSQGNTVRELKAKKASKDEITSAVNVLLSLKKEFKDATGVDWVPNIDISKFKPKVTEKPAPVLAQVSSDNNNAESIHNKVVGQGNTVRELKAKKASKDEITAAVNILLSLKKDFKEATGIDWVPNIDISQFKGNTAKTEVQSTSSSTSQESNDALTLHQKIVEQGNKVRGLKSSQAAKDVIKDAVNVLLQLKEQFKTATNIDWKPDIDTSKLSGKATTPGPAPSSSSGDAELYNKVKIQGDKVRKMKSEGADKQAVKAEVDLLLAYKNEFKEKTGNVWKPAEEAQSTSRGANGSKPEKVTKEVKKATKKEEKVEEGKKQTRLGMECNKEDNLSDWYSQVITKSEMIEYYNVSGCYILRPWSYSIWDVIKNFIDDEIKKLGIENCYFPIFVSKDALEKEKSHIEDFSPEVAWVTKSGSSDLAEPIAIRPTSETVMYPAYAKWIQSHRDLPLRLNQWNNVVRWEFKQPTPFLRTREFLWQEGHTAFATKAEATEEVYQILDIYARVYEELLAIPVVKGKKTDKEKFAGGDFTTTTEAFISASGRGIQGATSHHLGQNFSKMCDIVFEDPNTNKKEYVYQNSWGLTTRTIGVMVMVHGDNKGLVLPPRVACIQAVIMPVGITAKVTEEQKNSLYDECKALETELKRSGIRCKADLRDNVTPAWKFNHWELKGVPLRLELGPREVASGEVFVVRRDNGEKQPVKRAGIGSAITNMLEAIQKSLFDKAKTDMDSHMKLISSWSEFCPSLDGGNTILAPYCGIEECEDVIKKDSARDLDAEPGAPSMGAKSLCIPFQQPKPLPAGTACIHPSCNRGAKYYCLFGRSY